MSAVVIQQLAVDPDDLLVVEVEGRPSQVVVQVGYVAARAADGTQRIAMELLYDPVVPAPDVPYACPQERIERVLVPPGRVQRIAPYRMPAVEQ